MKSGRISGKRHGRHRHTKQAGKQARYCQYITLPGGKRGPQMYLMERSAAKERIKTAISCKDFLQKAPHGGFICPYCGSGTGKNGTGAVKYYPDTNKACCFAGCAKNGHPKTYDSIDLYMKEQNVDYNTALQDMADSLGITIVPDGSQPGQNTPDEPAEGPQSEETTSDDNLPAGSDGASRATAETPAPALYDDYYKACRARLHDPAAVAYLQSRGISVETAEACGAGFDPAADPANAPGADDNAVKKHPCPRFIFACSHSYYVGRSIEPHTLKRYRVMGPEGVKPVPFGFYEEVTHAEDGAVVFVTEGVFDALSIIECGGHAVAINSVSNAGSFVAGVKYYLKAKDVTFILAFDNDDSGRTCTETIAKGLDELGIAYTVAEINCGAKDPNEALQQDRQAFEAALTAAEEAVRRPDNVLSYIDNSMSEDLERFRGYTKTGFEDLDQKCGGGLYAGLYVVGAVSSLGKTTFCHQMADQIAAGGTDVLYFSLEQTRLEMVSKSLSRITGEWDMKNYVSSISIRRGNVAPLVLEAADEYKKRVGSRMSIIQGNLQTDVKTIIDYVKQHMQRTKTYPVVFVDYLQVLNPDKQDKRRKEKRETIDDTVSALQSLSRENIPVIVISSVNRSNYLTPIDFESFKESGTIEYTADVVWGLQLQCLEDELFDKQGHIKEKRETVNEAMSQTPREVQLVSLKNRYGAKHFKSSFEYYPACDLFKEAEGWTTITDGDNVLFRI